MQLEYAWEMPNSETFQISVIKKWIKKNWIDGLSVDPFARDSKLCQLTNDLDPNTKADYHEDAIKFLEQIDSNHVDLLLYDPPYSVRQLAECYKSVGLAVSQDITSANYYKRVKHQIARIMKPNGRVMTFGWQSGRIYKGFEVPQLLLVGHGGFHNDTICTLQIKQAGLDKFH